MIPVSEALARLFALITPLGIDEVALSDAAGRVLIRDAVATRNQPPFDASAMDGYAIRDEDFAPGTRLTIIGSSAAGRRATLPVSPGTAIRIFTGAPVPEGAARVILQEDVTRDGDRITLGTTMGPGRNIRAAGSDFAEGATLDAPRRLRAADLALLAAMNLARVTVARRPDVAILATGDELVPPGGTPGPDQIIASNAHGLQAMLRAEGAQVRILPIAGDRADELDRALARAEGADLILTIGGASVGDHDLVAAAAAARGIAPSFHKVAMRPGKPLMAGRIGRSMLIGLPGNPVSALVCGTVFVTPVIRAMQGLPARPMTERSAPLVAALPGNGPRQHYLRARLVPGGILPFDRQDSSLLTVLSEANALIVQPPGDAPRAAGTEITYIPLDR